MNNDNELPSTLLLRHNYFTVPTILFWLAAAFFCWQIPFAFVSNDWSQLFFVFCSILGCIAMGIMTRYTYITSDNIKKSVLPAFKINDNELFIGTRQELELYLELNNIPDNNVNFEQVYKIHKFD